MNRQYIESLQITNNNLKISKNLFKWLEIENLYIKIRDREIKTNNYHSNPNKGL